MSTRDFIEKDYYAALGVPKDADAARRLFGAGSRTGGFPGGFPGGSGGGQPFDLGDLFGAAGTAGAPRGGAGGLGDLLGGLFGGSGTGTARGRSQAASGPARGQD